MKRQTTSSVVDISQKPAADSANDIDLFVGAKLRHARRLKGLSLKALAEAVGCSESLLSKVENNHIHPSLQMLHNIVKELDTTIGALFSRPADDGNVVLRAADRPVVRMKSSTASEGVQMEGLVPHADGKLLYGSIHVVQPGKGSDGVITHQGEEVGYVLEGMLELTVNGVTYLLEQGDSFFFQSSWPHGYRNPGDVTARVLWINSPPTF